MKAPNPQPQPQPQGGVMPDVELTATMTAREWEVVLGWLDQGPRAQVNSIYLKLVQQLNQGAQQPGKPGNGG